MRCSSPSKSYRLLGHSTINQMVKLSGGPLLQHREGNGNVIYEALVSTMRLRAFRAAMPLQGASIRLVLFFLSASSVSARKIHWGR